ncbi:MAG: hypothetical protein AAGG11_09680 [Pseudomonadota bacterium]
MQRAHRRTHRWLWLLLAPLLLTFIYFADLAAPRYPTGTPAAEAGQEQLP